MIITHIFSGDCRRLNMNGYSQPWKIAASMRHWHGTDFDMVSLGSRAYAMGGLRNYYGITNVALNIMERYDENSNSWTDVAPYPRTIYRHCMAADEETGRIWVMGGIYRSGTTNHDWYELRYYEVGFHNLNNSKVRLRSRQTPGTAPGT